MKEANLLNAFKPVNLREQKEIFLENGNHTAPIFEYNVIGNSEELKKKLEKIRSQFQALDESYIARSYISLINDKIAIIDFERTRSTDALTSLYGIPHTS